MRVNYLPKNRSKTRYIKSTLILVLVFISGVTLFSLFSGALPSLLIPFWKVENAFTKNFSGFSSFFASRQEVLKENLFLKERVASLETELLSRVGSSTREALIEFAGRRGDSGVVATVLYRPPQSPYDTIIIDAGSNESLTIDSKVYLSEGVALGIVSEVFSNRARVNLFSSHNTETPAILERGNTAVVLLGAGAGNFTIKIPQGVPVEVGDRILSADISSRLLAVVGDINSEPTDSFKEVLAKSPVNIFNMRFVLVTP